MITCACRPIRVLSLILTLAAMSWTVQGQPKAGIHVPEKVDVAEAERKGSALVKDLLSRAPAEGLTNLGTLTIRESKGMTRKLAIRFRIELAPPGWKSIYEVLPSATNAGLALVIHQGIGRENSYELVDPATNTQPRTLAGADIMFPFGGSDFWAWDFGLEFLQWPRQLLLGKALRRGQTCFILESHSPGAFPGSYARVKTWLDEDTGGIVHAEAFDSQGRLLKQFAPKSFEKLQGGQWRLQRMEILNRHTGSRSTIEFQHSVEGR